MPNFVALDYGQHKLLRIANTHGAVFGDNLGMVSVVPTEIPALVNSYPLFFRKAPVSDTYELSAMLGFEADQNLFLTPDGWDASYVPLALRCAPFAVQQNAANPDRNTLMIDLASPRITPAGGDVLFFSDGRPSERLQAAIETLEALVKGAATAGAYAAALDALGLIEPVEVQVDLVGGASHNLAGLYTIAQSRLDTLPTSAIADLHARGFLPWVYQQTASVGQIANLILRENDLRVRHGA